MNIEIKNPSVLKSILTYPANPVLIDIISWLADNHGITITEWFREQTHPNDLHGLSPLRASDVRSWVYDNPDKVCVEINKRWIYDPDRPHMKCALLHNSGQGEHIHLQTHPRTVRVV